MNKNIKTEVAIGIILVIAILFVWLIWFIEENNIPEDQLATEPVKKQLNQIVQQDRISNSQENQSGEQQKNYVVCDGSSHTNEQFKFTFLCPRGITVDIDRGTVNIHLNNDPYYSISISEVTATHPYDIPGGVNLKSWLSDNFQNYAPAGEDDFTDKIGSEFSINNLTTLHLVTRSKQAGIYDTLYVVKSDETVYEIQIFAENFEMKDYSKTKVDLENSSLWYAKILKSLKFN